MQLAIPCSVYANTHTNLILKGGTDAEMAPLLDHMLMVFKPIAEKFGMKFECTVIRRYFYCLLKFSLFHLLCSDEKIKKQNNKDKITIFLCV
jgi:hypothetical protein